MFEEHFTMKDVPIIFRSKTQLPKNVVNKVKTYVEDKYEIQQVAKSQKVCFDRYKILKAVKEKKIDAIEYACKEGQIESVLETFTTELPFMTHTTLHESFSDQYGRDYVVQIEIGNADIELPKPLTLVEACRQLDFKSKFANDVLKRYVIQSEKRGGLTEYNDVETLKKYLQSLDLSLDKNPVNELCALVKQTLEAFPDEKFTTDEGKYTKQLLLKSVTDAQKRFEKISSDPEPFHVSDETECDMRLARHLQEIANLASETYARHDYDIPKKRQPEKIYGKEIWHEDGTRSIEWKPPP